ncbi:12588_t:CDS:1, partial [Acaulospora colombiana]
VSSDLCNKLPDFGASFYVLEAESIVLAIRFRPNNQGIYIVHPISPEIRQGKRGESGQQETMTKIKEGEALKEDMRTSLSLVNIVCSDRDLEQYFLCLLRFGNKLGFADLLVIFPGTKCRAEVFPLLFDKFIDLSDEREGGR